MLPLRFSPIIVALSIAACSEATAPIATPTPLPALQDQVWHVHVSDGQPLPALLGHRTVAGGILEQDFLDSARVEIAANGTWEHKGWYQRYRSGQHHAWTSTLDWGTWTATPTVYEFRRNTGELLYSVAGPIGTELQMNLRYGGQAGVAVSRCRSCAGRVRRSISMVAGARTHCATNRCRPRISSRTVISATGRSAGTS